MEFVRTSVCETDVVPTNGFKIGNLHIETATRTILISSACGSQSVFPVYARFSCLRCKNQLALLLLLLLLYIFYLLLIVQCY